VEIVFAQDVADVLAEKTLNAFAELLHPVHILLIHTPGPVFMIRWTGFELFDLFLGAEIPRDIGRQISNERKSFHRLDGDRLIQWQLVQTGHAHQTGIAIDLSRAGAALPSLAVPTHGQIGRLLTLNLYGGIEHHHPLCDFGLVIGKLTPFRVTAPNSKIGSGH
jgi:hypothetical protein